MIIEDLIRLGRPLLDGALTPEEVMELISDVGDEKVKNYYRHVLVVELPPVGTEGLPAALPMQVWGQEDVVRVKPRKVDFRPETARAMGAPFVLPAGGNWLNAQGKYGAPVYPCWDAHFRKPGPDKPDGFRDSPAGVHRFLKGRLARTPGFALDAQAIERIATAVHSSVQGMALRPKDNALGLLILARCGPDDCYAYADRSDGGDIGASILCPGRYLVPRFERILEVQWAAKLDEGRGKGQRTGRCSICGHGEDVVSSYCKAWPWAPLEWHCPLPKGGERKWIVEGVGLCEACYRALTLGACVVGKTAHRLQPLVTRELFSPVSDHEGRKQASHRQLKDLPTIQGTAYILPLLDGALNEPVMRDEFLAGVQAMMAPPARGGPLTDRYLDAVTGFDFFLPPEAEAADYRLTLIYFSGDPARSNVYLRAMVEDVVPSTLLLLREVARDAGDTMVDLLSVISPGTSAAQEAYLLRVYRSAPYLLVRAYGGAYLWQILESALRRRPLDWQQPLANAARRMASLVPRLPDSLFDLNDEVIFHLTFHHFLNHYHERVVNGRRQGEAMRPWKELLGAVEHAPIGDLRCESPAELGFACGALTRRFAHLYWYATKVGKEGKDYLKHRVLTFGSDLSPQVVWKRALGRMFEVAARYEQIHLSDDFRQRVGVTLAEFERLQDAVRSDRDAFMCAFWSGYALHGYDRPKKPRGVGDARGVERNQQ